MAGVKHRYWLGSIGPMVYTDDHYENDVNLAWDGVAAPLQNALVTTGQLLIQGYPEEDYNVVRKSDLFFISTVEMTAGQTELVTGTDIQDCMIEIILVSSLGATAETIKTIVGSRAGNIKIIIATDDNISIERADGIDTGEIKLKQPLSIPLLDMLSDDVVAIINFGGDIETAADGEWLELWRSLQT